MSDPRVLFDTSCPAVVASLDHTQRDQFCYHAGTQFLTAHSSFNLIMERSLQAVNPRVSLAFWDYMIEADTLGTE